MNYDKKSLHFFVNISISFTSHIDISLDQRIIDRDYLAIQLYYTILIPILTLQQDNMNLDIRFDSIEIKRKNLIKTKQ